MSKVPYTPLLVVLSILVLVLSGWALTQSKKSEGFANVSQEEKFALGPQFVSATSIDPTTYYQKYTTTASPNDPAKPGQFGGTYACTTYPFAYKLSLPSCTGAYAYTVMPADGTKTCIQVPNTNIWNKTNKFTASYTGAGGCPADVVQQCVPVNGLCIDNQDTNYYLSSPQYVYGQDTLNWQITMPISSGTFQGYFRNQYTKAYLGFNTTTNQLIYTNLWKNAFKFTWVITGNNSSYLSIGVGTSQMTMSTVTNNSAPVISSSVSNLTYNLAISTTQLLGGYSGLTITFGGQFVIGPSTAVTGTNQTSLISANPWAGPVSGTKAPIADNTPAWAFAYTMINLNDPAFLFQWLAASDAPPQI